MQALEVKKYPSSILRKSSSPARQFGPKEKDLLEDMARTMYDNQGAGLAAPQIGVDMRLAVVDAGRGLFKLVNPRILKKEGRQTGEEGCLSVPGIYIKVKRAWKILVEFMSETGGTATLEAEGLLARVIQHEIDHLNGRLIIDYLNPIKRLFLKTQMSHRLKETDEHR